MMESRLLGTIALAVAMLPGFTLAEIDAYLYDCGSRITWEADNDAYQQFFVESWARDEKAWERTGAIFNRSKGRLVQGRTPEGDLIITPGRLHRVTGCDENLSTCESSKAMWAPWGACPDEFAKEETLAKMDPFIEVVEGDETVVYGRSGGPPEADVGEYNAHLALRELWSFGRPENAPAMVKPLEARNPPYLRPLLFHVYWHYQTRQQGGYPDVEGTGYEYLAGKIREFNQLHGLDFPSRDGSLRN